MAPMNELHYEVKLPDDFKLPLTPDTPERQEKIRKIVDDANKDVSVDWMDILKSLKRWEIMSHTKQYFDYPQ